MNQRSIATQDPNLRHLINAALARRGNPIPPALAQCYSEYLDKKTRPYIFAIIVIGVVAFWSFTIADFIVIRDVVWQSLLLRSIFALVAMVLTKLLLERIRNIFWLECLIPLYVHFAVPIWLYLLMTSSSPDVPTFAYASLIFVLLLNIGVSAQFKTALVTSLTLSAMLFFSIWLLNDGAWSAVFLYSLSYIPVLMFSLVISWYDAFNGRRLFLYGLIDEMNTAELQEANQRLWSQSHTDDLTGLPNRSLLADRMAQALMTSRRTGCRLAMLFVDLDEFKPVNDTHGHAAGDRLLKLAANRMVSTVRESDTVARFGGDEFIILLPSLKTDIEAVRVAEKIIAAMREPFALPEATVALGCSIGIAIYPDHASDAEALQQQADRALYLAKSQGRNRVVVAPELATRVNSYSSQGQGAR